MKTLKVIMIGIFFFACGLTQAQVSINVNIGTPPSWGPSGYSNVEYYYLPDVQAYYDIRAAQFIYLNRGVWIRSRNLPVHYRNYDLYNGYKVVLKDYHGARPYTFFKNHKTKYYTGYKGNPQKNIGRRGDYHEEYNQYRGNNGNPGRGNSDKWEKENRANDKDHGKNGNQGKDNKDSWNNNNNGKENRGQGNDKH